MSSDRILSALRDGDWLDAGRARAYLIILAVLSAAVAIGYIALSRHGLDPLGKALGTDFASFWTASELALQGRPEGSWNIEAHMARQSAAFGAAAGYAAFFYPPPFLLVCLPLALVPYKVALVLWLVTTGLAWALTIRAWLGSQASWLLILAFPAVLVNAGHGQNGFLTAALLGAGALVVHRRPWLAGALFGALIIKPHLAVLVPPFLIFSGNWRAFLAAAASAAALCLVSLAVFGPSAWLGFFELSTLARTTMEHNLVGYAKMQSTFAAMRLLGASLTLAWAVHLGVAVVALAVLWRVRTARGGADGAALICATLLATPFLLDYDLTLLAVPLAWLFRRGCTDGFLPWERLLLLVGFVLPLISRTLALGVGLPPAPLVVLALLLCVLRRATAQSSQMESPALAVSGA